MDEPSQVMMLLRTLGSLVLVIGLIYALSKIFKKYLANDVWMKKADGDIKVLKSFPIEPRKRLMIVEVQGQKMVLGISETAISYLCQLGTTTTSDFRHEVTYVDSNRS